MKEVYYNGEKVTVLDEDKTHYLIQFKSGTKIATPKNGYKENRGRNNK